MVRRDPQAFGHPHARWHLATLRESLSWLTLTSQPGLWRLLDRLGIHYQRARDYVHSPDPHYAAKLALIAERRAEAWAAPERYVLVWVDEAGYYRQPSLARAYEQAGPRQPLAYRSYAANSQMRIVAALRAFTGQVTFQQHRVIGLEALPTFWQAVQAAYPWAETIYAVVDNWPIHFHPDVLACLEPQRHLHWPRHTPAHWRVKPSRSALRLNLPIQLLGLPTYASWCNPIEKLWRWLRQNVLHLHRLADDWPALRQRVAEALDGFSQGSQELLHYVGLLPAVT